MQHIDVSQAGIESIDVLNQMTHIITLNAKGNYISKVKLCLKNLKSLVLSNNFLKKIPNLKNTPSLSKLWMNANSIEHASFKHFTE